MQTQGRRLFNCGLVIIVVTLMFAMIPNVPTVKTVSAESSQNIVLGLSELALPKAIKTSEISEVQKTGIIITLPLDPKAESTEREPTDPPFDPNVRVWGDVNEQSRPTMAVNPINGHIFIAFQHFNGADWDIYLTMSKGGNSPWMTPFAFANTAANEENPSMAVTSTGVFVLVYQQDGDPNTLYFGQSIDSGSTWSILFVDINAAFQGIVTNIEFPRVATQTTVGSYPKGMFFVTQAWCTDTSHCSGGAHVIIGWGSSDWSSATPSLDLGGFFYYPWGNRTANNQIFVDSMHPSIGWSNKGLDVSFDDEWYQPDAEWTMVFLAYPEDGSTPPIGGFLTTGIISQDGIYSDIEVSGQNSIVAGSFLNATEYPNNPNNHNIVVFSSTDNWGSMGTSRSPLYMTTTDQRAASLGTNARSPPTFHLTYYSDAIMTDWWTDDVAQTMNGPQKVSDNAGTAVNDDLATSVSIDHLTDDVYIAWQDNRDGDTNIYTTVGVGAPPGNDTVGPRTRNPMTIPNPYAKNYSTYLKVVASIDDTYTGSSNITNAQLVLTNQTMDNPLLINWTNAWSMNLTGINKNPVETAWLWANETAVRWPLGSCHRFWIRGQDGRRNWGLGDYVDVCVVTPTVPRAATMIKAVLSNSGYTDVTLTWSKSPDDGGGSNEVTSYRISRSENIHGPFSIIANVPAAKSLQYSWTDHGAGHNNYHNYFYYVVATTPYFESPPTKLAGKFFRSLSDSKHLLSFPLEQADYDPMVVFQTFDFIYIRTYVAGTPNPWWCHKPGRFINSLTELSILQGYWVQLDGPGTMTVAGLVPENVVMSLKSGWNMIGFPSFYNSYTFADLDADIGGRLQLVEIYDPTAGPYYLQKVHRNSWSTTYILPGYAYMVRVSVDVNWAVPNS